MKAFKEYLTEEQERKIINPKKDEDGLFVQPKEDGKAREAEEEHNRERFAHHFNYADPYSGNVKTFDSKGDYNCGRCNQAQNGACLLIAKLKVDHDAGSCGDWEGLDPNDSEMNLGWKTAETAGYGVAVNGKGFGCFRCPFASKAFNSDSKGRDLYCKKGDFRVFGNACCVLNGAETK